MGKLKVLITTHDMPQIAIDILKDHFEIIHLKSKPNPTKEELLNNIKGIHAIIWSIRTSCDKELLDAAGPQLKVISSYSAGLDYFDVDDVKSRGIVLLNVREVVNDSVADAAVLLTLAAARRLEEARRSIVNDAWSCEIQWMLGMSLQEATVGIVGLGGIGTAVIRRLKGFGVKKIVYCGHKEKPEGKQIGACFVAFDELLKESDIVVITCPLTEETENMFNKEAFNKMKNTAVLVNVARGQIIDQDALIEALETKKIFAAGLDVMVPEPLPPNHKLLSLPNCVLTPHLGSATMKTRSDMARVAAENVLKVFNIK